MSNLKNTAFYSLVIILVLIIIINMILLTHF